MIINKRNIIINEQEAPMISVSISASVKSSEFLHLQVELISQKTFLNDEELTEPLTQSVLIIRRKAGEAAD
jgi:hypothetical protein